MSNGRIDQPHSVHRLIQALSHDPAVQQRFMNDREGVFREFGISAEEVAALEEGSITALERIGVHPILRMHWLMISNPAAAAHMSVVEYLPKFRSEG